MAKLISMPTTPNFVSSNFTLIRTVGTTTSPFTGKTKTQEYDGVYWMAEVVLPPMRRSQAVEWQSFLSELNGPANHFKFSDPDALTKRGTYSGAQFRTENRVAQTSATVSFTASTNTVATASNTTPFTNALVGDFIVITGATNEENNGTHKIVTKTNAYTITVDPVAYDSLVDESNVSGCTIKCNVKGATGLCVKSTGNSGSGTIIKCDYLAVGGSSVDASGYSPSQYLITTQNATETNNGGSSLNQYGIKTEPKLRSTLASNTVIYCTPAKGKFRLMSKEISWTADKISNFGISFTCVEVI